MDRLKEWITNYVFEHTGHVIAYGQGLLYLAGAGLIAGVLGNVAIGAASIKASASKPSVTANTLANLYPDLPTWWVPETFPGALPYLLLGAAGISMVLYGRDIDRAIWGWR